MPKLAIAGLEYPVALVGKVDEARRHALPLQRGEELEALTDRHAEIKIVVNDQHGGFELAEVARQFLRRVLLVGIAILAPGWPAVLPFIEP